MNEYNCGDFVDWLPPDPGPPSQITRAATDGPIAQGGRNTYLTSRAGVLRRRKFSPDAIEAALQQENLERCDPPLPADEVRTIARSIGRKKPPEDEPGPPVTDDSEPPVDERLAEEIARERARREARRLLNAEECGPIAEPELTTLRDWLARPEEPIAWRIDGWQPTGSRVILVAQFKAGKTTALDNLVRSLVDGDPWLDDARVAPLTGRAVVLDFEMSRHQLKAWLREQRIRRDDRVIVVPLRGRAASFNILDSATRTRWANWLRQKEAEYLVIDCLRPILDALGLDEHSDAGQFLVALDALLAEAGIPDCLLIHHMGHLNERARGDSRLRDWPDVEWRLVRQTEDPSSARFIVAYGRDVDVPESQLRYEPRTRRLTLAGGSRRDAEALAALPVVLAAIDDAPEPPGVRDIQRVCGNSEIPRDRIREALKLGIQTRAIQTQKGKGGKVLHFRARSEGACERAGVCGERAADSSDRACECAGAYRAPHARTLTEQTAPLPDFVTEDTPPDPSDPIGAHDENAEPYVFEVDP